MNRMNIYLITNIGTEYHPDQPHSSWMVYAADKKQALAVSPESAGSVSMYRDVMCELIGTSFEEVSPSLIFANY